MQYIGSKKTLLPFLKSTILNTVKTDLKELVFCDLFAGTGIVGHTFKPLVKKVIANDIEYYSFVLNRHLIGNHLPIFLDKYFKTLNELKGKKGFIYNEYSCGGNSGRLYFSAKNGQKIDSIRLKIREWKKKKSLTNNAYYFLLASLLESADKVANTTAVYSAYLKQLKPTAQKTFVLKPATFVSTKNQHQVYNQDANKLIKRISGDILYLDPPYNGRQYGANYHLLNTIALYKPFLPKGKTGQRTYYKSDYCSKRRVVKAFRELIADAEFKYIFLSYNNEGLLSSTEIREIMSAFGNYKVVSKPYKRYTSSNTKTSKKTLEFFHILEKF